MRLFLALAALPLLIGAAPDPNAYLEEVEGPQALAQVKRGMRSALPS